jgi:hypothetical protein
MVIVIITEGGNMRAKAIQLFEELEKDNKWFESNYEFIQDKYEKKFIAIKDNEIIANATNMNDLTKLLKSKKINPAFTLVKFIYEKGLVVIL